MTQIDLLFEPAAPNLKRCSKCSKLLPPASFHPRKAQCRACVYQRHKAYYQRYPEKKKLHSNVWIKNHPEKAKEYARRTKAKKAAYRVLNPKPPKIRKPEMTHAEHLVRREAMRFNRERPRWIAKWVNRFTEKYGTNVAESYSNYMKAHPRANTWMSFELLNSICLPHDFKCLSWCSKERIAYLNKLKGFLPGHVGWNCSACGLFNINQRFFDVDHKLPRSKGGDGRRENMQILCPNCHRLKTCDDYTPVSRIVDAEISPDQPEDAAQPSCMRQNI